MQPAIVLCPGTGGPLKPEFGLSRAVLLLDRGFLPRFRIFVSSSPIRSLGVPRPTKDTRSLHSTNRRCAVICFGRDDRAEEISTSPLKPKSGLSGAQGHLSEQRLSQQRVPLAEVAGYAERS